MNIIADKDKLIELTTTGKLEHTLKIEYKYSNINYRLLYDNEGEIGEYNPEKHLRKKEIMNLIDIINKESILIEAQSDNHEILEFSDAFKSKAQSLYSDLIPSDLKYQIDSWEPETILYIDCDKNVEYIPWEILHDEKTYLGKRFFIIRKTKNENLCYKNINILEESEGKRLVHIIGENLKQHEDRFFNLGFILGKTHRVINRYINNLKNLDNNFYGDILHFTCCGYINKEPYLQINERPDFNRNLSLSSLRKNKIEIKRDCLIFANPCANKESKPHIGYYPMISREFFLKGARYFIGTQGTIPIDHSVEFPEFFYKQLLIHDDVPYAFIKAKCDMDNNDKDYHILYAFYGNVGISRSVLQEALNEQESSHLRIEIEVKNDAEIHYQLNIGVNYLKDDDVHVLPSKWDNYIKELFDSINKLNLDSIPAESSHKQLREIGLDLYNGLFSEKIQNIFALKIRDKIKTILLILDEKASQIPWELIVIPLKGDQGEYKFLCESYQVGRWLLGSKVEAPRKLRINPMALITHNPGDLNGIDNEVSNLNKIIKLKINSITPQHKNLMSLFKDNAMNGCFSLHMSGENRLGEIFPYYNLFSLEDEPFNLSEFNDPDATAFGEKQPFVFLNFCESNKTQQTLCKYHGWASVFLGKIGSPCLIATMWKAKDESAAEFSPAFYNALLEGKTVGRAMQIARNQIKNRSDPTWLCYILYGDPRSTVLSYR